jgi:hypothetical protein
MEADQKKIILWFQNAIFLYGTQTVTMNISFVVQKAFN